MYIIFVRSEILLPIDPPILLFSCPPVLYHDGCQDLAMFQEGRGSEVVWGIADYWVSRVTWSAEENCYYINGEV